MKIKPIVIKDLSLADLCAFEAYVQKNAYGSPTHETERQAEKRMVEQERWRSILDHVRLELRRRTREVI
jgi:hypothetical protein